MNFQKSVISAIALVVTSVINPAIAQDINYSQSTNLAIALANNNSYQIAKSTQITYCDVTGIETGQLALRLSPGGKPRAGLDNGNRVRLIRQRGIWSYVLVEEGPNDRVTGLKGWVNSNYLSCTSEPIN